MINKRKKGRTLSLFAFILIICFSFNIMYACYNDDKDGRKNEIDTSIFSVEFINVGMGDASFINFGNGKNMLIDVGIDSEFAYDNLKNILCKYGVQSIDYLFLTHPDDEHIGNAIKVLNDYSVKVLYLSYLSNVNEMAFPFLTEIKTVANTKNVDIKYINYDNLLLENDVKIYFLYPEPISKRDSPYNNIYFATSSKSEIDELSSVVLIEYLGCKFLFSSDMTESIENKILEFYDVGIYKSFYGQDFSLENIDFYKVANHGSNKSNSQKFLNKIKAKYAVVSVGGNNGYGYPNKAVFDRLILSNENVNFYRTDVVGNITVVIDKQGNKKITTN